jgi:hypothetical protein
MEEMTEEEL